jgi:hypothetical protein
VAGNSPSRGFNLPGGEPSPLQGFQAEFTEADFTPFMGKPPVIQFHLLSVFCSLGLQHVAVS